MRRWIDLAESLMGFLPSRPVKIAKGTFEQYSEVKLLKDITYHGIVFPAGTDGIIVEVYDNGTAYAVEFSIPSEEVITVDRVDLYQ